MKSLLIFAVIALAANAHLGTPAYHLGFSEQLGLTSQQLAHASTCFNSFKQVLVDIHQVVESKNNGVAAVLRSLLNTVQDVEDKLKVDCAIYLQDLAMVILRNTNGDIKGTVQRNFDQYTLEIIQQFALYFDALAAGNHYQAGHVEAYILQILFGLEKPKTHPNPEFNMSKYVPMNITKYSYEFVEGYFQRLGFNDNKAMKDNAECSINYVAFVSSIQFISHDLANAQDIQEKTKIIEKVVVEGLKFYESCVAAYTFNWEHINKPILAAFQNAPVHTVLTLIHNIAINLPELKQHYMEMVIGIMEGEYKKAGILNAELLIELVRNFRF